jgi:hypothetical protein
MFQQYASLSDDRLIAFFMEQNPQYRVQYQVGDNGSIPISVSWNHPAPVPVLEAEPPAAAIAQAIDTSAAPAKNPEAGIVQAREATPEEAPNPSLHHQVEPINTPATEDCATCGVAIPHTAKFCPECGASQNRKVGAVDIGPNSVLDKNDESATATASPDAYCREAADLPNSEVRKLAALPTQFEPAAASIEPPTFELGGDSKPTELGGGARAEIQQTFLKYLLFAVIAVAGYICWLNLHPRHWETQNSQPPTIQRAAPPAVTKLQQPLNDDILELMRFMVVHQPVTKPQIKTWLQNHNFPVLDCNSIARNPGASKAEECKSGGISFQVDNPTEGVAGLKFDTEPNSFQKWHEALSGLFADDAVVAHQNDPIDPSNKKILMESYTWTSRRSTPCANTLATMRCGRWSFLLVDSHEEPGTTVSFVDAVEVNSDFRSRIGAR